ncbi:MAG: GDP-L-fucose synthase family protein [Thermoanaerobaculia bacterium]
MEKSNRIFIAGHRGLVGGALLRKMRADGFDPIVRGREELDLLDQDATHRFFRNERIEYAVIAAGLVGGVQANSTQQAEFLYENIVIAANTIHAAFAANTEKLLFLGSSCIYPRMAPQPIPESALLTGPLEPTNEGYAVAKIAALKLCEMYARQYGRRFISAMPTNLYGPGDNFHPDHSHVIPGMMRRFHEAKVSGAREVRIWGTGTPRREFLHVDDLADALLVLMERYEEPDTINVGSGEEVTIRQLAETMRDVVGYPGAIAFDASKPDGTPRKLLDSTRMHALGWAPKHSLREGLASTYRWALEKEVFAQRVGVAAGQTG